MSDETVVIQTRDRTGRTVLWVYGDVHDAERKYLLASAGPGHAVHVEPECPHDWAQRVKNLSRDELVNDPWQDLGYLTTHTRDGDGYVRPINRQQVTSCR